jgi:hypothetical protein
MLGPQRRIARRTGRRTGRRVARRLARLAAAVALLALAGAVVVVALSLLGNPGRLVLVPEGVLALLRILKGHPAAAPDERQRHLHNG